MYAQVCTHPDITFIFRMLDKYLNNTVMDHWKAAKRVMLYLQRIKDYMILTGINQLEIIVYSDSYFARC